LQNEVSDDSVHIFRFGSRILPTRVNYKSQTRHATDPFYDGPVVIKRSYMMRVSLAIHLSIGALFRRVQYIYNSFIGGLSHYKLRDDTPRIGSYDARVAFVYTVVSVSWSSPCSST
jgi:hypothetical protein